MVELSELSAAALLEGYLRRDFSPVEVIEVLARRIEQLDPMLGAFSALCLSWGLTTSALRFRRRAHGRTGTWRSPRLVVFRHLTTMGLS
jgi:aspartyl-tRNA(Asn)/glutamyl-tRNA(Gln) amidotransferase subunit A